MSESKSSMSDSTSHDNGESPGYKSFNISLCPLHIYNDTNWCRCSRTSGRISLLFIAALESHHSHLKGEKKIICTSDVSDCTLIICR